MLADVTSIRSSSATRLSSDSCRALVSRSAAALLARSSASAFSAAIRRANSWRTVASRDKASSLAPKLLGS
eukprot:scaffold271278_cov30-Tisochrysis_lutea.AAC.3